MNILIVPDGGMPFHGDDLAFMQAASSEAFKGVLHLFAAPHQGNLILSGCEVTNQTVAPGFVMLDYEVLFYPGGTLPSNVNDGPKFVLAITYQASGNDVFADSIARDTYEVRRALVVDAFSGLDVLNGARLAASVLALVNSQYTEGLVATYANGWSQMGQVRVRHLAGGSKHLYGTVAIGSVSDSNYIKMFSLPDAAFYPGSDRYHLVPILGAGFKQALLKIRSNGDVEILVSELDPNYAMVRFALTYL